MARLRDRWVRIFKLKYDLFAEMIRVWSEKTFKRKKFCNYIFNWYSTMALSGLLFFFLFYSVILPIVIMSP